MCVSNHDTMRAAKSMAAGSLRIPCPSSGCWGKRSVFGPNVGTRVSRVPRSATAIRVGGEPSSLSMSVAANTAWQPFRMHFHGITEKNTALYLP